MRQNLDRMNETAPAGFCPCARLPLIPFLLSYGDS